MKPIIRVESLGKQYRIGARQAPYATLRESLVNAARAPLGLLRRNGRSEQNTIWALKDVSFKVMPGEVVGIIGRNGAGKSTLLKVLSRITEPTVGEVDLYGRVGSLLEVGTGFHGELTGRENIFLSGAILGMKRTDIRRRFDEIVSFAEVEPFVDTPVKHYSTGMYLRLAFAVAAHLESEIMMVDEVLAVGDAEFQRKCLRKMDGSAREGRTVLFVSHNMNAVEQLCSEAILLERGQMRHFGKDLKRAISEYLVDAERPRASEWLNVGDDFANPWFKPLRFFISDNEGNPARMPVSNDAEIWVQIEAEIQQLDPALTVGYAIYTEANQLLYWSYQTDQSPGNWPSITRGLSVLRGRIPERFLNEGEYRVELIGSLHCRQWFFEPGVNAPCISLGIQGGLSNSPHWMWKRPGILAPVVEWISVK